jgi:hypothetical protein
MAQAGGSKNSAHSADNTPFEPIHIGCYKFQKTLSGFRFCGHDISDDGR